LTETVRKALGLAAFAGLLVAGVFIEESMGLLHVGDRAPQFSALLNTGETVTLDGYRGKQSLVLFF
jgi:peroxiredoxin